MYLMTYNKDLAGGGGWKKEISPFIHIVLWILGKGEANENSRHDMVYLLGAHKLKIIIIIIIIIIHCSLKLGRITSGGT
jgi:hypothetical protein